MVLFRVGNGVSDGKPLTSWLPGSVMYGEAEVIGVIKSCQRFQLPSYVSFLRK